MSPASDGDDGGWPDDAVEVGRVTAAFGVQGWFKVQPYAADPQALFSSRHWLLRPPERPGAAVPASLQIVALRNQGDALIARATDMTSRAQADALKGARIFVARKRFPAAAAGEYYWVDLIGLTVINRHGEMLGEVLGLLDTGAHSVLRVGAMAPGAVERLIPFVAAYVDEVDLPQRRIRVDWGLDY